MVYAIVSQVSIVITMACSLFLHILLQN